MPTLKAISLNYVLDQGVEVDIEAEQKWGGCNLKRRMSLGNEIIHHFATQAKLRKPEEKRNDYRFEY